VAGFRLSRAAADDLVQIYLQGLTLFGAAQADRYHDGLGEAFAFLADYPLAARLRDEIAPPVRVHRYQSHLIVYELAEDDTVLILRVRHGREEWLRTTEKD
jgi:toxin ParE1/3/4